MQVLDAHRSLTDRHPALAWARVRLLVARGEHAHAAALERSLGPPTDALSAYLAAAVAAAREPLSLSRRTAIVELLQRAVREAPRRRALYHFELARALRQMPAEFDAARRRTAGMITKTWGRQSRRARYWAAVVLPDPAQRIAALRALVPDRDATQRLIAELRAAGQGAEAIDLAVAHRARHPGDAVARLEHARAVRATGDPATAIALVEQLLADRPDHPRARMTLGQWLVARGDFERGADQLRHATRIAPGHHNLAKLALALRRLGQLQAAEQAARRAVDIGPHSWQGHYQLGMVLRARGEPDAAADRFERALECSDRFSCRFALGDHYATRDLARAEEHLRAALRHKPEDRDSLALLGRVLLERGSSESIAVLERALPPSERIRGPRDLRVAVDLAEARATHGEPAAAIATLNTLGDLEALPGDGARRAAVVLRIVGQLERARQLCEHAVARSPRDAAAWDTLATVHHRHGDAAQALAASRRAVALEPDRAAWREQLAQLLRERGETQAAREELLIARACADITVLSRALSDELLRAGRGTEVARLLGPRLDQAGVHPAWWHIHLGRALRQTGDTARAVRVGQQATRLNPDDARAHCYLGLGLEAAGDLQRAVEHLRLGARLASRERLWDVPADAWLARCERKLRTASNRDG